MTNDIDQARYILSRESESWLALRRAKARCFLGERSKGKTVAEAWQIVALETADLEAEYERAHVEATLLRYEYGQPDVDNRDIA
jgi:hypothetical protein